MSVEAVAVKEECEWWNSAEWWGVSEAARAGLYAGHEVKRELVLGPEVLHQPRVGLTAHHTGKCPQTKQPRSSAVSFKVEDNREKDWELHLRDCEVRLERSHALETLLEKAKFLKEKVEKQEERTSETAQGGPLSRHEVNDLVVRPRLLDCAVKLVRSRKVETLLLSTHVEKKTDAASARGARHVSTPLGQPPAPPPHTHTRHTHTTHTQRHTHSSTAKKPAKERPRPHSCDYCEKKFQSTTHLRNHTRIHTGEAPFACELCQKRFKRSHHLTVHIQVHLGAKPYSCDTCLKEFRTAREVRIHKRIHTGEKPHSCDVCAKRFTQTTHLTIHRRIHTGEKPYMCDICKKKFTTCSALKSHERVHTRDRPYSCDVCVYKFSQLQSLKRHKLLHTGQTAYYCDLCKKHYTRKGNLVKHLREHARKRHF